MSEPFANEMLSAYLDGELSEADRNQIEASLASDAVLRDELDQLTGARDFLAEHGPVAAPSDFLDGLLAAIEDEPQVVQLSWYRRPFGIPIEGLAVAAAALLVVYIALPGGSVSEPAPGVGAGAARIETPKSSSSYTQDAVVDAEVQREAAATSEGTVDPMTNTWEPPAADNDGVAVIDAGGKSAGVSEQLKLPAKKGFDIAQDKSSLKLANEAAAEKVAALDDARAKEEAARLAGQQQGNFARVPYSYALYTEDAQVLYRLAAIAAKHRGEVTDQNKQALSIAELTGTEATTVIVQLPAHALQDFGRELGALGSVYSTADNRMFAGDPVEVRVEVQLSAGSPQGTSQPPNAAKQRRALDELDEPGLGEAL